MKRQLITVLLISSLFGQEWIDWQFLQPTDIAIHPDSSHIVYLSTGSNFSQGRRGGLMVSYDNGNTFDTLLSNLSILEIEFHPFSPDTLFLAAAAINFTRPGVVKVVRQNAVYDTTWIDAGIPLWPDLSVGCIEINSSTPETMFIGTVGFGGGDIWRSLDGGSSWSDATPGWTGDIKIIKQNPANPNEVFYSSGNNRLYRSVDLGESWFATTDWGGESEIITSITLFPDYPSRILISTYGPGAYLSEDSGESWTSWLNRIPSLEYGKITTHSSNSSYLYLGTADSVFFSNDFGESWLDYTYNRDQLDGGIEILKLDTQNNRLFTGAHWSGLFSLDLSTVAIAKDDLKLHDKLTSLSVFPNPANSSGILKFNSPRPGTLTINIYDILGRRIITYQQMVQLGNCQLPLEDIYGGRSIPNSGIYIIEARIDRSTILNKFSLIK